MMVASTSMPLARTCMNEQIARMLNQLHHSINREDYDLAVQLFNGTMSHIPSARSVMIADLKDKENAKNREKYEKFYKQLMHS
eukprot:342583-Rhodomonas_salina.1